MALTVPTNTPVLFDFFDNESADWPARFVKDNRRCQRSTAPLGCGSIVENVTATELLRRYYDLVHQGSVLIQNLTEFKRGGAINIALDQYGRLGFVWAYRPIVPQHHMDAYRRAWDECSYIPLDTEAPWNHDREFLGRVVPLIGTWSLECSRGYSSIGATALQTAAREADEELRVRVVEVIHFGGLHEDVAQNPAMDDYVFVRMDIHDQPEHSADPYEKLAARGEWISLTDFYQAVRDGHVTDPYTLAALQMLQIKRPDLYGKIIAV